MWRLLAALACAVAAAWLQAAGSIAPVRVDYPAEGSVFPPEISAPSFVWHDASGSARFWLVEAAFGDGAPALRLPAAAERARVGPIDERAVSETNQPPRLSTEQAGALVWTPGAAAWAEIKRRSTEGASTITITGFADRGLRRPVARGTVTIRTSRDAAGAPIFYRDVPLMPSELEKGVIKPLDAAAVPLIAWRLRDLSEPRSRLLLDGMHTCANCHSFSADGKTLGMDLDGPQNDKGLYAIVPLRPVTSITGRDVISWTSFRDQPSGPMRVGFMSQISPDGRYVVTTVGAEKDLSRNYYVANFKDYRFLQVFYATRGTLAWYDRQTGRRLPLPGADDPRYVQTNAVWSPDGKYLVFARAEARDPYPPGRPVAEFANDPNEAPVRYDLYRIPFNDGRGGTPEPIAGASGNGMSNSFPRVSPDGRWIVFVQARNGLLMRPDSRLFIVPAAGGEARRMRCNTALMNSWHSFSPNGRWLVFASKAGSPYTRMYLTHIDENGDDSPAILVENATAANRAVNLPEFVNIPAGGLEKIEVPAAEFYAVSDRAWELARQGRYGDAAAEWVRALALDPDDARAHNNLAFALARLGRMEEAIAHWRKALAANDELPQVHGNLARALMAGGREEEAVPHWRRALELGPDDAIARENLGVALLHRGEIDAAVQQLRRAVELDPAGAGARYNLGVALLRSGHAGEAIAQYQRVLELGPPNAQVHNDLAVALLGERRFDEAVGHLKSALGIDPAFTQAAENLGGAYYLMGRPADAVRQWRAALASGRESAGLLNQTAWVLATSSQASVRNGAEAVKLASRAVELTSGTDPALLDSLAAAYAEAGRFEEADSTARRALDLARRVRPALAGSIEARLALYGRHQPFREPARLQTGSSEPRP